MPLILAIEPDRHQANQLSAIVRGRLNAELVIEATAERALEVLGNRVPDLILVAALLSPRDEAAIAERLRALDSAGAHIHTLTIPVLAAPRSRPRIAGVFSALRREKAQAPESHGCDPAVFADQCATYLERAMAERKELDVRGPSEEPTAFPEPVVPIFDEAFETQDVETRWEPLDFSDQVGQVGQVGHVGQAGPVGHMNPPGPPDALDPPDHFGQVGQVGQVGQAGWEGHMNPPGPPDPLDAPDLPAAVDTPIFEPPADADEPLRLDVLPDPSVDEAIANSVIEDLELPPVVQLDADAPAAAASTEEDRLLGPSPLLEILSEREAEEDLEREKDLNKYGENLDAYIELDLSEFLDQPGSAVHAGTAALNPSPVPRTDQPSVASARNAPAETLAASEGGQGPTRTSETAPAEPDEADWLDVVEGLRRDVERLDAAPAATTPVRMSKPIKKSPRKTLKGKPIQDEWGFFDPEQCGFAALLAKLDEVTTKDAPARPRNRD
jgi:hypothetical protein